MIKTNKKFGQLGMWIAIGIGMGAALTAGMDGSPAGWVLGMAYCLVIYWVQSRRADRVDGES